MTLVLSLVRVGSVLLAVSIVGWFIAAALLPPGARFRCERLGWGYAVACALLIACVPPALALRVSPSVSFVVLAATALALARRFRLRDAQADPPEKLPAILLVLVTMGVAVYALRALTEPMWANDFIAIWGLKGKTIFGASEYPERFYRSTALGYSHPEYPLGLPLLYAGVSFLTRRWDDHAMALLFPAFQSATVLALVGWLRRRGTSQTAAFLTAGLVAWFEPLYSSFLTGMAEVPLSFGVLLFGTSLADALEQTDARAIRRLVVASALIASLKNEGLFFAAVGCVIALVVGRGRRWSLPLAALVPALLVRALHYPWRSRLPLADFDRSLFSVERIWDSLAAAGSLLGWTTWAGLAFVAVLIAFGRRVPSGDRLLVLASCALAAYLIIPAFAVRGPAWLIETTLLRTTVALAPLVAAATAVRYALEAPGRD